MPEIAGTGSVAEPIADTGADVSTDIAEINLDAPESGGSDVEVAEGQPEAAEGQPETSEGVQPSKEDGRQVPQAFRELFKDPANKALKDAWFTARAIRDVFPGGMNEARQIKELADSVGGPQGFQDLMTTIDQERADWNALDEQFATGDPAYVDNIAEVDPGAFCKLMPRALEKFIELDKPTYEHLFSRILINTLNMNKIPETIKSVMGAIQQANPEAAKQLQGLLAIVADFEQMAVQAPEKKVNEAEQKYNEKLQELEQRETSQFQYRIAQDTIQHIDRQIGTLLDSHLKARGMSVSKLMKDAPDDMKTISEHIHQRLSKAMNGDPEFKKLRDNLLNTKDEQKILRFYKARVDKFIADAVRQTYSLFFRFSGGQPKPGQKPAAAAPKPGAVAPKTVKGNRPPRPDELDYPRMGHNASQMISDGKVYLKGRKEFYTW
jgi:hypothetical protein